MKIKRLFALLLTLLLAVSCTTPVLATSEDGFLDQFEITVPALPTADNTVADVLGTTSVTTPSASATYNNGETNLVFYPDSELCIRNGDGKKMDDSDGFAPGQKVNFWFAVELPEGMDINNSLISEGDGQFLRLDLPVYLNGTQFEEAYVSFLPEGNAISVNAYFTVPSEQVPSNADALKEVFIDGLVLPHDGLKVADSYAEATVYFDTPDNTRQIMGVLWQEITADGHLIDLADKDSFEGGKDYRVEIKIERRNEAINEHPDPDTARTWIVADVYVNSEKVYTGTGTEDADFSLYDTYRFSNHYTCAEAAPAAALTELHIDGLAMPEADMTVYQSLTECVAKELTETSMTWYECTPEGNLIKLVNTDRFKAGTEYYFSMVMDCKGFEVDNHTTPAPNAWVIADVYLNGKLIYNGVDLWDLKSDLSYYTSSEYPEEQVVFSCHYTAGEASAPLDNPFTDVGAEDYYYDPVLWAYNHDPQITDGITDTTFGPKQTVTRGQCVTFLWRSQGCPEPTITKNPFVDVPASQYYYKAVLWAVEKGITDGVDDTHFAPDATLSTAHIITFLFRTLGVGSDGWYVEAGNWAAGKNLLDDTGLTVDPKVDCPRGSVVTFLYRELK